MRPFLLIPAFVIALLAGCDKVVDPTKSAPTEADTARAVIHDSVIPVPRSNTPIVLPDSLLDTTRLHLANAKLLRVDSGALFATLTIEVPHPGVEIGLLMRSHEKWQGTGGCYTDTTGTTDEPLILGNDTIHPVRPTLCWDGIMIVPQNILVVGFDDPIKAYAQVVTTLQVAVPWSALDNYVIFHDRHGDSLSVDH